MFCLFVPTRNSKHFSIYKREVFIFSYEIYSIRVRYMHIQLIKIISELVVFLNIFWVSGEHPAVRYNPWRQYLWSMTFSFLTISLNSNQHCVTNQNNLLEELDDLLVCWKMIYTILMHFNIINIKTSSTYIPVLHFSLCFIESSIHLSWKRLLRPSSSTTNPTLPNLNTKPCSYVLCPHIF